MIILSKKASRSVQQQMSRHNSRVGFEFSQELRLDNQLLVLRKYEGKKKKKKRANMSKHDVGLHPTFGSKRSSSGSVFAHQQQATLSNYCCSLAPSEFIEIKRSQHQTRAQEKAGFRSQTAHRQRASWRSEGGGEKSRGLDQKSSPPYLHLLGRIFLLRPSSLLPPAKKSYKKVQLSWDACLSPLHSVSPWDKIEERGENVGGDVWQGDAPAPPWVVPG